MASGFLSKVKSNVADKIRTKFSSSEYVVRYNQFVTDDNWGPSAPDMDEIARMYPEGYYDLLPEMQLRLDNRDTNWRKCYKTLLVIDHLARTLSENYIEDLRAFVPTLLEIRDNYNYTDSTGTDRGQSVRERAKKVLALLRDESMLREEREKAAKTRRAMQGVGCVDGVGGDGGKYSGFGSGARSSAPVASSVGESTSAADSEAEKRKRQEEADRRLAQALQDEEEARARVEARRRARGESSPTQPAPPKDDDGFGELQAAEAAAEATHSAAKPAADDDFGAFVATRSSDPATAPGKTAGATLDDMFAAPAPTAASHGSHGKQAAPATSIDDIFGAPAPAATAPVVPPAPPGQTAGADLDIFAGPNQSGATTLNQQVSQQQRRPAW
eukprot:CAMPEP_0174852934 /NCGR_PEP_ID=MMETSP1114-20130205/27274_1 /TAXON_ID=312471 /ORGANISM="Neobodo designis, Strain CCAP 1951/1" /LENGTH=385 /DNA_ID=CAMNT_0016087555 /DNA_START=56 /DNA_END=1213 /DNA_ORIENTATION=-